MTGKNCIHATLELQQVGARWGVGVAEPQGPCANDQIQHDTPDLGLTTFPRLKFHQRRDRQEASVVLVTGARGQLVGLQDRA